MIIDYPWYYLLFCLLAGLLYAGALYLWGRKSFSKRLQWWLAGLRFLAVSAIAFLLLAPLAKQTLNERQKPLVVIAQDVSQSMGADTAVAIPVESTEKYDVVAESFGGTTTDIASVLTGLSSRYQGRDIGAVILATDGIYNRGENPATVAERLSFPVFTVALGDTTPRHDAALTALHYNKIAFSGNTFPIEVTVTSTLLAGRSAQLSVLDAHGKTLAREAIKYDNNRFSSTVSLSIPAKEPGLQRFTLSLSTVPEEAQADNNSMAFYVDIIDSRRKVAIIGNAPHPDLAALKHAVESNTNYQAEVLLASDLQTSKYNLQDSAYSLAILHNLPSSSNYQLKKVENLPVLYIIGTQTDLARFNSLHTGLEIVAKAKKLNEVTAIYNNGFSLFSLEADDAAAIEQLPPLTAPFGESHVGTGVQMLFSARLGNIDSRQPLVAATAQGGLRRAFIWGEGLWRWRLNDFLAAGSHDRFDRLISQLVNFTAMSASRDRFIVEAERLYSDNDVISLSAQLYNDAYEPFNAPEATLTLKGDTMNADYTFSRNGNGYLLSLGRLPEGIYHYSARVNYDGETLVANGAFAVEALHLEQMNLVADHTLLNTISTITGGKMLHADELSTLNDQLASLKPIIYTHTRFSELLALPWVLALLLLLLTAEWFLRKYNGTI